ncbi:MAG: hypothetical protein COA36_11755 [Desulfotalea sp.]|nr:MAG: hypothetical protein COA36_11755 [Desulfotalea sp.]
MASKTQQFVYAIRAKYEGKGELAALSSDLTAMGRIKSFEKLQTDFAGTTAALTTAKSRMRELKKLMNAPGGDAFTTEYKKAVGAVQKLSTKLRAQKADLSASSQSMRDQGFVMGDLAGEYKKLDAKTVAHGQKIAAFKTLGVQSFASVERKVQSLHGAYKILEKDPSIAAKELHAAKIKMEADIASLTGKTGKLVSKVDLMKRGLAGIAGLTAGGYVFGGMIQQAGTAAKELDNFARVAGTSVEEFSATAYAVESVGVSAEKLADMSKDVKDKIGDFIETGGGEFKDFFEKVAPLVGITADELIKMSGPDCLVAIKKAMDDANISAESQVFYLESIANDASLLTPLLKDNGKALKEKADRARELGIVISDMDNTKLVEMATVTKDLGKTMNVLTMEIVSAVAPAVQVLMGYAQKAVIWFNQLSPGMQKFIVYAGAGTVVVLAMGVAFAPLITSLIMGAPLLATIATGIGGMSGAMTLGVIASKALSIAMRGIPFVGIAIAVYQVGSALGIWEPIMNAVHRGAIRLGAGIQMLGLKIRWLWNVMTGDGTEAAAIEKRMEEVDSITAEMLRNVGRKQDEHVESTKENQEKLTAEVLKGANDRLAIEQEVERKIAALSSGNDSGTRKKGKKEKEVEQPDEFGILPSERRSMDDELAKLDAIRSSKNGSGYKKEKNKDGTWDVVLDREETKSVSKKKTKKSKKDELEKLDEFGQTKAERTALNAEIVKLDAARATQRTKKKKNVDFEVDPNSGHITSRSAASYPSMAAEARNRIAALPRLDPSSNRSSSSSNTATKKTIEIKFPSASLYGDEDATEKVIADLQRMGAMA